MAADGLYVTCSQSQKNMSEKRRLVCTTFTQELRGDSRRDDYLPQLIVTLFNHLTQRSGSLGFGGYAPAHLTTQRLSAV